MAEDSIYDEIGKVRGVLCTQKSLSKKDADQSNVSQGIR